VAVDRPWCVVNNASVSVDVDFAHAAFQRFVEALNRARDPEALRAAVVDDVQIDRHAPGARVAAGDPAAAPVAESFRGIAEVERWLVRTPPIARFGLAGAAWPDGDAWAAEYTIDAGEFHNGGLWLARLAGDGRIAFLSHRPFALRDQAAPAQPHGGSPHTHDP
jgi:hypothetical protein